MSIIEERELSQEGHSWLAPPRDEFQGLRERRGRLFGFLRSEPKLGWTLAVPRPDTHSQPVRT